MFTGIVEEVGFVRRVVDTASGARLEVSCRRILERLSVGDSVNVAGTCLTVTARDEAGFTVDVVPETLSRSSLGAAAAGGRLNLERAAMPTTLLGGHIVQGHVDGTTTLLERETAGDGARLRFALPPALARYVVEKGFIALDGASLTIASIDRTAFELALIPHTAERTTLGALREGSVVNVEVDIIGKYVERLLEARMR
ncbi:MAG: riboflavin synthase [Chloroflexota bacterium]|nr:riboflavin synthase [Chloroflexota bacterium]